MRINKRTCLLLFVSIVFSKFCLAQDKQKLYDSLIVGTWKTIKAKIDDKEVLLNDEQKDSRVVFTKSHSYENITNDFSQKGKWIIDEKNMNLIVDVGTGSTKDQFVFKIISISKDKLIITINTDHDGNKTQFECVHE